MSEENNYPFPSFLIQILNEFEIPGDRWEILPFGSGLINSTWKVGAQAAGPHYILQRINEEVFTRPEAIAENMARLGNYLDRHFPDYLFIKPIATHTGRPILHSPEHGWFRLLPFVEGSHSVDTVHSPELAFEAARQFGRFTSLLSDFPLEQLQITLPHFHDLSFRYLQFEEAMGKVPASKKEYCLPELQFLTQRISIVHQYEAIRHNASFPQRVIHHDTKISNTLFDNNSKGLCVIDLDTVMPGFFISDVGDMCRTYLCEVSEASTDLESIDIRLPYYEALASGYLGEMNAVLTPIEISEFTYAGKFLIYMQALRFLTDHLQGNTYYPVNYAEQNLDRTRNQIALLTAYERNENAMKNIVGGLTKRHFALH